MSDKKKPIDLRHLGGRKILEPILDGPKAPVDFSHIGGKCIRPAPEEKAKS
jgi:hypothetical protein